MQYPRTSYIIYATPRTGSNLLCDALAETNSVGRPMEYIMARNAYYIHAKQWGISLPITSVNLTEAYFEHMYATATPNGVFGLKLMWQDIPYCLEQIRKFEGNEHLSDPQLLATAFPQHRSFLMTRRDKVRQALSWWKAWKTDIWTQNSQNEKNITVLQPDFNFREIEGCRQLLVDLEHKMEHYFAEQAVQPFRVVYEDFVVDYEETVCAVLGHLHLSVPKDLVLSRPRLQKQSDEQTEEWVQQYYQAKQAQEKAAV